MRNIFFFNSKNLTLKINVCLNIFFLNIEVYYIVESELYSLAFIY